ncbi:glyoxylate/hydroxypyruvate reductase A [Pseudomonas fluorescens]|uniref:Glyoxylate/hydroxypyruvate reductase A n=1 Tax=Pseudomonas fluorescens TaxID=294 RepID=A0A327MPG3_PSEFL|nr:glyoxylate/hydroxypyruvate reductase A [Pseudomonas fluorescens]RAI64860.1 glyoxylate/hydroxypyruvate reductase A [Pseudomonas fluorescens]
MIDNRLHIYFHSNLDDPEQWRQALTDLLGPIHFSVDTTCCNPQSVDIALLWTTPSKGLAGFTGLRAVLSLGAGINQLDLTTLAPRIPVARLVDRSLTGTMVDYARATVFRYHRSLHRYEQDSRAHRWSFQPPLAASACTIGVLGLGELGQAIAGSLLADGFRVLGWSRSEKTIQGIPSFCGERGLAQIAAQVDILINVLPLTEYTQGILNNRLFSHFSRPVKLINIGRGDHLVEHDLLAALHSGQVEAATLDVSSIEPLPDSSPLWGHPNILITPHVAGLSSPESAAAHIADNIKRAIEGKTLINQVDLAKGY